MPCRHLKSELDKNFENWKDHIEYIDIDEDMTKDQLTLIQKLGIMGLPSFTDEEKKLFRGFKPSMVGEIKKLCSQE